MTKPYWSKSEIVRLRELEEACGSTFSAYCLNPNPHVEAAWKAAQDSMEQFISAKRTAKVSS